MYNTNSSPKIHNCIVWGNGANSVYNSGKAPTYKYSLVEGLVLSGNGNLNGTLSTNNPLFVDADNADIKKRNYQLQVVSPCINSASLDLYDKNLWGNKDINGNSRAMYLMDMGAYEHQALAYPDANSRIYVNKTKRGLGNSWETAFTELADALAIAEKMNAIKENTITEIWVAEGTYKPLYKITNGETDREKAFVLINNVRLYGGFDGTETTLNERKWKNNPTILSGDIGMPNDNSDNCYHVVIAAGNLKDIHLDGFTITGGNANSDSSTSYDFKRIEHNRGGGIYNSKCQYLIINTIITENTASEGGGMYNYSSNPNLTRVTFSNNTAENGGGMCNFSSNPQLINILISSNTARYNGGGMYNYSSSPFLTNATVVNNNSRSGIYNHESSNPEIANSIIALSRSNPVSNSLNSTPIYKYSFVEGITEADEEDAEVKNYNIPGTLNPKFIDPDNGNYTLREDSPCKDSGNYDLYFNSLFKGYVIDLEELAYKDINGNEREVGTTIDMGAYEYQGYTWQSSKKAITLHPRLHPQDELFIHCDDNDNWEINTQGENYEWLNISSENGTGTTKIEFSINEVKSPRERKKVVLLLQNTTTTDLSPIEITIICEPLVIWYVKSNGTTTANNASAATSWDAACNDLQAVINTAAEGDEIWVAAGTYFPTLKAAEVDEKEKATTDRDKAFVLKKNVKIYGGFLGTEATLNERSWESNKTVLSGDIGTEGDISDNCYHVVISAGDVGDACLDGFTITGGNANMNTLSSFTMVNDLKFQRSHGGGIFMVSSSPALTHLTITGNTSVSNGGGIRCKDSSSRLNQVVISENVSTGGNGGGAFSATSWLSLTNVVVRGNRAGTSGSGGGIYSSADSLLIMTNVFITGNTAGYCGGGMYNNFSSPTLTNVTICGNTANSESGGIYNLSSSPLIRNSIIWGNTGSNYFNVFNNPNSSPSYRYSILEGEALSGNGNLDGTVTANAPLFVDAENGDFRLKKGSPGIDAGSDSLYDISMYGDKDLNGKQRFIYTIDMGAYENQIPKLDSKGIIYVNKNKTGEGNSWSKPMTELADALYAAEVLNAEKANTVKEIWVAAGTYYPTIKAAEIDTKGKATTNRDNAFVLLKNVKIYGGFTGTESSIEDRDWINNPTILSGDRGVVGDNTDNCFHVVISHDDVGTALLDGFTITDGNANGYQSISVNTGIIFQGDGGGMYNYASSPTLNNVTISGNTAMDEGGGMCNYTSSPTLNNVTISGNTAMDNGGGMYNKKTSLPTLNNVTISKNTANLGGGMYNNASSPTLNNVTINKNTAKSNGGGMCNYTSSPTLNNVTISKNTAKSNGGGMYNNYSTPKNYNCIIWGNGSTNISNYNGTSTYKYSIVEGVALSGDGNLNGKNPANAPLFMDAENGNFRLKKGSPGIDAGSNDLFDTEAYGDKDLGGNSRILGKAIDMGAYESIPDSKWIGTSAEWNNSDNWSYGIPTGEIDVILPSGAAIYPSITESDQATTNSITFAYGAELGNQHLLNYNKAFVEFDFNIDKLDRDRYYFISAPLLEMVSGDFFFGGKPEVWVRYAQALEVTGGDEMTTTISELSLTKNLANYAVDLNPGFGFAYRVDSDTRSTQKNLEAKDNKLVLPRFEYEKDGNNADSPFGYSAEDYGYNQHEAWDSQNNTSHFYYFYKGEPDERAPEDKYQDTKVRSKNAKGIYKANRFMTEAIHGSLNIAIGTQGKDALMGNPFLSHIDFVKFFTANSSVIEPYFKVYNGTAVEHCYYNTEDDKVYTTATEGNDILSDGLIAPMQAFFIKPKDESATSVSLSITPEMTTTNNGFSLKSSNEEQGEVLSVTLNCNEFSSSVVLLRNTEANGAGVPKLFSNLTLPEIFINQERVAKAIAEIDKQTQSVSLGIRKGTGNASLTFSGMEHFTDTEISLYDNLSEKTYPLTAEMNTYNFEAEGDAENRFYLLFKDSNTGMEEMKASQISVYGKDRSLIISSDPTNRIEAIKVLSVQGIVVKHYSNLSAVTYQTPDTFSEGVYVVEVNTEKRKEVKKVIIK